MAIGTRKPFYFHDAAVATGDGQIFLCGDGGALTIVLTGTWTGSLAFEGSIDGGLTFFTIRGQRRSDGTLVTSLTANDIVTFNLAGINAVRLPWTRTTGTLTVGGFWTPENAGVSV